MVCYVAYVRKEPDSDYSVECPDVRGCITAGRTLDEARAMVAEALAGHLAVLAVDGQPVPGASTMKALKDDPDQAGALLILVAMPANFLKTERVNVMIPRHLLERIDAVSGANRSRFLVEAAEQTLAG